MVLLGVAQSRCYDSQVEDLNIIPLIRLYITNCESLGTHVIAMVEAIIGNINHLSKNANS